MLCCCTCQGVVVLVSNIYVFFRLMLAVDNNSQILKNSVMVWVKKCFTQVCSCLWTLAWWCWFGRCTTWSLAIGTTSPKTGFVGLQFWSTSRSLSLSSAYSWRFDFSASCSCLLLHVVSIIRDNIFGTVSKSNFFFHKPFLIILAFILFL